MHRATHRIGNLVTLLEYCRTYDGGVDRNAIRCIAECHIDITSILRMVDQTVDVNVVIPTKQHGIIRRRHYS